MTLRFTIPGDPVGKGRPRIDTRGKRPRTFTPDRTVAYEHAVAGLAQVVVVGVEE